MGCKAGRCAEFALVPDNEHVVAAELAHIVSGALQQISELAEQYQQVTLDILHKALPDGTGRNNLQAWASLMIKRKR